MVPKRKVPQRQEAKERQPGGSMEVGFTVGKAWPGSTSGATVQAGGHMESLPATEAKAEKVDLRTVFLMVLTEASVQENT